MNDSETTPSAASVGFWLLLGLLGLVAAGKVVLADTLDPDCFWHLRVADEISRQGWPHPIVDTLSFASTKTPWTPYSWLAELGMKKLWDAGGFRAAVAVQAAMETGFILLLGGCGVELSHRVHGRPRYLASALAAAFGGMMSLAYLSFRPVTAAIAILALIAFLLLRDRRLRHQSKLVWLVPLLTALLINIHFFAIFVPLWTGALLLGDIIDRRASWRGASLFFVSAIACLCTPLLAGTIASVLHYSASDVMVRQSAVAEFRPFYLGLMGNISAAFIVILALCVIYHRTHEPRLPLGEVIWLIGSTVLLFRMGRMSPVFAIIAAPVFAAAMPALSDRILVRRPVVMALALILALAAFPIVRGFPGSNEKLSAWLNRNGPDAPNYPCQAADYVAQHITGPTHHLLCDLTWGGFLEWRLAGRYQTLMDGRTQLFSAEFWRNAALGSPRQRRQFLGATPADVAVVRAGKSPLADALTSLNWKTVYRDDFARVMVPPEKTPNVRPLSAESVSKTE